MIYPLIRRMARRAGWLITSTYGKGGTTSQSYPLSEGGDGKRDTNGHTSSMLSRKKRFRHPLSIQDTQWNLTAHEDTEEQGYQCQTQTGTETQGQDKGSWEGARRKRGSSLGLGREWERLSGEDGEDRDRQGITVVRETIVKSNEREGNSS